MKTELLWVQMITFSKGWGVYEHVRDYYQLCYVLSGTGDYILEYQPMVIRSGDLIFMPPGCSHGLPPQKGKGLLRYLNIQFRVHDEGLAQTLQSCPLVSRPENLEIGKLLLSCRNEWYSDAAYNRDVSGLHLEQALLLFIRETVKAAECPAQSLDLKVPAVHKLENEIVRYIDLHYDTCTLDLIAQDLKYNKNYLCSHFKKATGQTINNYINQVRISKARDLLCHSDYSISAISGMVGFSSVHYFCKAFKKATGYTPNKIRPCVNDPNAEWRRQRGDFGHRYYVEE